MRDKRLTDPIRILCATRVVELIGYDPRDLRGLAQLIGVRNPPIRRTMSSEETESTKRRPSK